MIFRALTRTPQSVLALGLIFTIAIVMVEIFGDLPE